MIRLINCGYNFIHRDGIIIDRPGGSGNYAFVLFKSNLFERAAQSDKTSRYFRQFSELRGELYSSPQTHLSVEKLASCVNLSKSYFQHIYKELFGCSVSFDIINGRLEYAKYLLDNSSLSVSAISKMCGYENDTHFMRQFKKFVGVTPSQYKSGR